MAADSRTKPADLDFESACRLLSSAPTAHYRMTVLHCRVPHFATRATLLSTEVLKSKGMYAEAAAQLIKMTSEVSTPSAFYSILWLCTVLD